MRYILNTSILDVKEQFKQSHIRGSGKDAEFESVSLGWFVLIDGVCSWLFLSHEEPGFKPGDEVRITIERTNPCPPSLTINQTPLPSSSSSETPSPERLEV